MPLQFAFAFGVGSYFSFSLSIGTTTAKAITTGIVEPSECIAKSAMTSAMTTEILPNKCDSGTLPIPSRDVLDGPSSDDHAHCTNITGPDALTTPCSGSLKWLKAELNSIRAAIGIRPNNEGPKQGQYAPEDTHIAVTHCPLFTKIPVEVRVMIYRDVLLCPEYITHAHDLIGYKTLVASNHHAIPNIDSRLLQTCRLIYEEALPILYGENVFEFNSSNAISLFAEAALSKPDVFTQASALCISHTYIPTFFAFKSSPSGRLMLLRTVRLRFAANRFGIPFAATGQMNASDRDDCWADWSRTLFSEGKPSEFGTFYGASPPDFPSLERLILDFNEWGLTDEEALMVEPILRAIKKFPKLESLVIEGVFHQATLDKITDASLWSKENQSAEEATTRL